MSNFYALVELVDSFCEKNDISSIDAANFVVDILTILDVHLPDKAIYEIEAIVRRAK